MPGTKDMKFTVNLRPTGGLVRYSLPVGTVFVGPDGRCSIIPPSPAGYVEIVLPEYGPPEIEPVQEGDED